MRYLDPPWAAERHVLETLLSSEECRARIEPHIAPFFAFRRSQQPLRGSVSNTGFNLAKNISTRNSFQTFASGRFESTSVGTRIRVKLALSPFVAVFICLWLGGVGTVVALAIVGGVIAARTASELAGVALIAAIPTLMLMFGLGLLVFGRWVARDEADFLMRFLADTLDAHEVPSP